MNIKEDKGLILIIIGILLSITLILIFIGIPLIIIGTYYLNKKVSSKEKEVEDKLNRKREELDNIDIKLEHLEKEKQKEIDSKLNDKKEEIANIDSKLKEMEEEKQKEINEKLKEKTDELNNIDNVLKNKEEEINTKLNQKKDELNNIDNILKEKEKQKAEEIDRNLKTKKVQLDYLIKDINDKKKLLGLIEDEAEIGLYEPKYDFVEAVAYKEKLDEVRKKQKERVKNKMAAISWQDITFDGSKQKGKAMTNANIKQLLRNFNIECEIIISKVKLSNRESSIKKIKKAFETLNSLNERNFIKLTPQYLDLKLQELDIAIEYALKKEEEKEILRQERERQKEERKIQKQLDAQEKKINKAKIKAEKELKEAEEQLKNTTDEEKEKLEEEIKKLKLALEKSNKDISDISEKRKRTGAGYVYILSNIGSFGENVYKIGVTRRDDPMGRVTELSDASVPFRFDNHVFIFSEEAFELEKELHSRFDHKRVNKVNMRKEFFNITLDDVKKIVDKNKDLVHSFIEKPEAQEYYDTLKMI